MKRLFSILFTACAIAFAAVSCYDDSTLKDDISLLHQRLTELEILVKDVNQNISDLWAIVNALNHKVQVNSVEETSDGWAITFEDGKKVTVSKGGGSLNVSVKKDTDGKYYWTLDGNWLTNDKGEKISASGVPPQLKIENDYWYISYDGGSSWTKLDKSAGAQGGSIFQTVSSDDSFWYFVLSNGEIIKIGRGVHGTKAIVAIPDYPDGSMLASGSEFALRFKVLPEDSAEGLASESTDIFCLSVAYTHPATKAAPGDEAQLPITAKKGIKGKLTLTVDGSALATEFIKGVIGASACLSVVYGDNVITSGYFPLRIDPYNGHEWVDLGLPSGLKWATCNVGASSPEGYGDFFAWGETEPYYEPGTSSNPVWKPSKEAGYDWPSYKWCNGDGYMLTKYCPSNKADYWNGSGSPDNKTVLDPEDDAAVANWGGNWRTPTDEEWTELRKNCTWTWTDNYKNTGIKGRIVTASNGNSIFIPFVGALYGAVKSEYPLTYGHWSSSIQTDNPSGAWFVYLFSYDFDRFGCERCVGLPIRPVCD